MTGTAKYPGRLEQTWIYLKKQVRVFVYENDWKVLPMSALIAALVTFVVGANLFVTQEGTLLGTFALVCVCVWNGYFNSIQIVCRERAILKREHRSGLHMSSYIAAHMIFQLLICTAQVIIMLVIFRVARVSLPKEGLVFGSGTVDIAITLLLATYAADIMSLFVSCLVHTTTTAMTVMPFLLLFQLIFSGGFFQLGPTASRITPLTVSRWGLESLAAIGRYNDLPMVTLWNTVFKFKDIEVLGEKPILELIYKLQEKDMVNDFLLWSGSYNQNVNYASTSPHVVQCWLILILMIAVFAIISVLLLERIDKDKR